MFKKKCSGCGKKIDKKFDFCPYCGEQQEKQEKQMGGFFDELGEIENFELGKGFFPYFDIFKIAREIEKEFHNIDKNFINEKKIKSNGISISITTVNGVPTIKVKNFGIPEKRRQEVSSIKTQDKGVKERIISEEKLKLPRKEAKTKVRRLSDRIIYEIEVPGVKSINDIFINKLQNSIEIKVFCPDKAYFKLIPVALPIKRYWLENEKLILELLPKL